MYHRDWRVLYPVRSLAGSMGEVRESARDDTGPFGIAELRWNTVPARVRSLPSSLDTAAPPDHHPKGWGKRRARGCPAPDRPTGTGFLPPDRTLGSPR